MITVKATSVKSALSEQGGTVDIFYNIEIEDTAMGSMEYHLSINPIS